MNNVLKTLILVKSRASRDGFTKLGEYSYLKAKNPRAKLMAKLNITLTGHSEDRHALLVALLGRPVTSAKEVTVGEAVALIDYLLAMKDETPDEQRDIRLEQFGQETEPIPVGEYRPF